jgi:lantibiotic leader peptide-processing serine protease
MVDLSRSTSLVPNDNALIAALLPGRNQLDDLNGHGTNVATQVSSNATIFAGVNSRTRLIGVKVLGANGGGTLGGVLAGIIWAADHGADVANMSLGVAGGVDKAGSKGFVGLTNKVFNYASRAGMVVVVSAGNDALNLDGDGRSLAVYCEAPHVICVSATGPTASANAFSGPWANVDAPASYSNTGRKSITVSAPGGTGAGWVSSVCARHLARVSGNAIVFPCNAPPCFFFTIGVAGTSQAAPHVTGVVAQLIAKYGARNPARIKQLLLNGLDDLGPPGPDDAYGAGRVNLLKALSQ